MILAILIGVYVLSGLAYYQSRRVEHGEGGEFENINPHLVEVIATFVPLVNTVWGIINWICIYSYKAERKEINTRKFFKLK